MGDLLSRYAPKPSSGNGAVTLDVSIQSFWQSTELNQPEAVTVVTNSMRAFLFMLPFKAVLRHARTLSSSNAASADQQCGLWNGETGDLIVSSDTVSVSDTQYGINLNTFDATTLEARTLYVAGAYITNGQPSMYATNLGFPTYTRLSTTFASFPDPITIPSTWTSNVGLFWLGLSG